MTYAAAWERWFTLIESAAAPLSRRMLTLASVGKGHRVLDIGTGIGEPAMTAAIAVGPGGGVFAIDPDERFDDGGMTLDEERIARLVNLSPHIALDP